MKIRVPLGGRVVEIPVDEDTIITIASDDNDPLLGIDFSAYDPETATLPAVTVGCWRDGQWVTLATIFVEDK